MKNISLFLFGAILASIAFMVWGRVQLTRESAIKKVKQDFLKVETQKEKAYTTIKEKSVKIEELKMEIKKLKEKITIQEKKQIAKNSVPVSKTKVVKKLTQKKVSQKKDKKKTITRSDRVKITKLLKKIKFVGYDIQKYNNRAKNPDTFGLKKVKKGWNYKSDFFGGKSKASNKNLKPMSTLPKNAKRSKIRVFYYSRAEHKALLKKKYLAKVKELIKQKAALSKEVQRIRGKYE